MNTNKNELVYAYVSTPANADLSDIAEYCRTVYKAGYFPVCSAMDFALFLNEKDPKDCADGARSFTDRLKTCAVLIVCEPFNRSSVNNLEIVVAQKLGIPTTSLAAAVAASALKRPVRHISSFDCEYGDDTDDTDDTYDHDDISIYADGYHACAGYIRTAS